MTLHSLVPNITTKNDFDYICSKCLAFHTYMALSIPTIPKKMTVLLSRGFIEYLLLTAQGALETERFYAAAALPCHKTPFVLFACKISIFQGLRVYLCSL